MTDRDNITLPREVVEEAAESLEWADSQVGGDDCYEDAAKALRTALAAPEPERHPGYVIGSHWLETAYSRVCAGEAEADVLRDCGWERVDEALRRDAERYRWLRDNAAGFSGRTLDAAIDAAMQEDKT